MKTVQIEYTILVDTQAPIRPTLPIMEYPFQSPVIQMKRMMFLG
jgi:hypothetical protein